MDKFSDNAAVQALRPADLLSLADGEFLDVWRRIVGEPPAVMLARELMVEILFSTWPAPPGSAAIRIVSSRGPAPQA